MNNRTFAFLALSIFFISGCTPLITNTPVPPDSNQETFDNQPAAPELSTSAVGDSNISRQEIADARDESPAVSESISESMTAEELLNAQKEAQQRSVLALCDEIGNKLGSVSVSDCLAQSLTFGGAYTVQSRPIAVRDFLPANSAKESPRILIIGGLHGDEYSSISIMFRWMEHLEKSNNRDFNWRFAPTVNPDGLLDGQAVRQNANGVDLNRNFPSDDWLDLAQNYWTNTTNRNPRRYPGSHPASEPEVQWVVEQINSYKPDVIVSVHAPYHLLDYDGPPEPPEKIGELHLHLLGVYPGSLGNYAGINLGIPVVTMELPSAGIMPTEEQITKMWNDLLAWLYEHHDS